MGKTLRYGEFDFGQPKARPTAQAYKDGGSCYAKGGMKKPASKAKSAPSKTAKPMKREPEAVVRREMAMLKQTEAPMAMKKGGMSKMDKKIGKVMGEFGRGELHSGSKEGPVVKNPKQAIAIAYSEGRKATKKADGGQIVRRVVPEGQTAPQAPAQDAGQTEKQRAESRVLRDLSRKYDASLTEGERRAMQGAARDMGSRPVRDTRDETGSVMTEGERARMMGRKNYAKGGSVESKLKAHAKLPAAQAHGPRAAAKLAKGGVPTFSRTPKVC
jgi:hypothetical protein